MRCQQGISWKKNVGKWFFFSLLAAKALVENKCKILQLAVEILNDLHQQKTKILLRGLTQKTYKPEEREQKLSAAEGDVHREFKKQKRNYSEDRLCKNLLDHPVGKKSPRHQAFSFWCIKISSWREERCCLPEIEIADSKPKDWCTSEISEINQIQEGHEVNPISERSWETGWLPEHTPWEYWGPRPHCALHILLAMEEACLQVNVLWMGCHLGRGTYEVSGKLYALICKHDLMKNCQNVYWIPHRLNDRLPNLPWWWTQSWYLHFTIHQTDLPGGQHRAVHGPPPGPKDYFQDLIKYLPLILALVWFH